MVITKKGIIKKDIIEMDLIYMESIKIQEKDIIKDFSMKKTANVLT